MSLLYHLPITSTQSMFFWKMLGKADALVIFFFLEGRRRQETSQLSTTSSAPFLKVLFVFVTKQLGNENIYPHKSLYMHILSSIHKTKEKLKSSSTDTCSNMNEPWNTLSERSQSQKATFTWFHLYEMPRKGKSRERQKRFRLPRAGEFRRGKQRVTAIGFFCGMMRVFYKEV